MAIVPTECPVELRPLTAAQNNRPALPMPSPSFVTVHEVGNTSPGADEDMHANFVHNGGGVNQVSFHFVVGPTKAIQLIYLNENAWHASDYYGGRGNRDSIAIETIQIGNFERTLNHLSWLVCEIFRNPNRFAYRGDVAREDDLDPALAYERIKQHNYWAPDKKNCPQFIRGRGMWEPLLAAIANELKEQAPDLPKYHDPMLPDWWNERAVMNLGNHVENEVKYRPLGSRVTALKTTGAYAHGWDPEMRKLKTRGDIKKGETVSLRYIAEQPNGKQDWGITSFGSWIALKYFTPHFEINHVSWPPETGDEAKWTIAPADEGEDETPGDAVPVIAEEEE